MKGNKSLKYNVIMNAILTVSSIVFPLITFPYTSRILGPEGLGKIGMATSYTNYFIGISQLGIPLYGIRACAQVKEDKHALSKVVQELVILNAMLSALAYVAFFVSVTLVPKVQKEKVLYIVISSTILFNMIGMEWLYKALEQYSYITYRSLVFKIVAIIAMFLWVKNQQDYVIYGGITILAASASSVCNFTQARKYIFVNPLNNYDLKRHLKPILIIYAMSIATSIYENLDNVMLGFVCSENSVGYYNTAVKVKGILVGLITSIGAVLLPRSSYYLQRKEYELFAAINNKSIRVVLLCAIPLMVFFTIFADESILFLAGDMFARSVMPMRIIMPNVLIIGITFNLGMTILVPAGKEKYVCFSAIGGAIINLIVNATLIPSMEESGAAIGTVMAEFVVLLIQTYFISKDEYLKKPFNRIGWKKMALAALIGCVCALPIKNISDSAFLTLLMGAMVYFGIYCGILLVWKEETITEILGIIWKKFKR